MHAVTVFNSTNTGLKSSGSPDATTKMLTYSEERVTELSKPIFHNVY